jgi:mitochondrial import inner membrane translocase subunit TIM13
MSSLETKAHLIRQQANLQINQNVLHQLSLKCFSRCVPKPGDKLSKKEEACVVDCSEAYRTGRYWIQKQREENIADI